MGVVDEYHDVKHRFFNIFRSQDIPHGVLRSDTKLGHRGIGIIIARNVKIGHNVFIGQYVTIGNMYVGDVVCSPVICDNVMIRAYACVIGKVVVGENSIVGAGAVITKDVPPNCVMIGHNTVLKKRGK